MMISDVRAAWRSIVKMPVLAAVVVVSPGVGIGVNTAVFSWIQAVVLRPLPGVADAGGFHSVEPRAETGSYPGVSWLEYADLRERLRSFPDLLAFRMAPFNVGESGRSQRTLTEHVEKNLFLRRIPARMFVVLGPLLLVLAATGIYAVVAYTVSQRTTEIGVRLALGATGRRVVSQIVGETLRVIAVGAMAGWAIAFAVNSHLLRGPVYPSVFVGVPVVLLLVAAVACWVPAQRAARVDPMVALRQE